MNNRALLIGLAILITFFYIFSIANMGRQADLTLAYSDFLKLVEQNRVESVHLQGDKVRGLTREGTNFITVRTNDPNFYDLLKSAKVVIEVSDDEGSYWLISLIAQLVPIVLVVGIILYTMRRMPGGGGGGNNKIMSFGKSKATRYEEDSNPIRFENVAGVEEAKEELVEIVDFLRDPSKFWKLGGKIPKGVLMVGPPGTGKTLLARAVAGEAGVPFFSISGSDFVEMFVGVGASRVRDLFQEAFENKPCIIFIDEIDAVGRHRGAGLGSGHDEREQTLNALLVEMDGFDGTEGIITIAATNRVDILDPALTRPGRFDRQVNVGLPDIKGRKEILQVHSKKIALKPDTDLSSIAKGTPGFSGAELANLINESALHAAKSNKSQVELEDLEWARDKVMMGAERRSMIMTPEEKEQTAYHEAGHALVAAYTAKSDPVHKITIIPRGQALGVTAYLPEGDRLSMDRETLIARIKIALGGRAAEDLTMNDTTTGVEGDLKSATNIAYRMISQWGMSKYLGALSVPMGDSGNYLAMDYQQEDPVSEEIQKTIDDEVKEVMNQCYQEAKAILIEHRDKLDRLAKMLLEHETVNQEEFFRLIGRELEQETAEPDEQSASETKTDLEAGEETAQADPANPTENEEDA